MCTNNHVLTTARQKEKEKQHAGKVTGANGLNQGRMATNKKVDHPQ